MRTIALAIALLTLSPTPEQSYESLKRQAESSYSEKSYGRAHELYEQIAALSLPAEEKRWVDFRLADTAWRADASNRDAARKQLEELIRDYHDRVSAEAEESLGDFGDQPHYLAALEWWASSSDIDDARRRYLLIAFRMTSAPRDVLANAMSIAQTTEDRDHARFLLAQQLGNEYTPEPGERALELLDAIIADGKQASEWYDDALMIEAARLTQPGRPEVNEDGSVTFKPDYTKALELYRRLLTEFTASETRFYQQAQRAAEQIDEPSVTVGTAMTFLPQSEQQLLLAWRNVRQVSLSLTPVDLVDDVRLSVNRNWTDGITTSGHAPIRRWTYDTNDRGDHAPSNAQIRITPKLAPGAYVVEASASDKSSRQLVLVTDANIVMHQAGGRSDLFVCDAETGQPIAGARLRVWQQRDRDMTSIHAVTDANGFATARNSSESGGMLFVAASAPDNRQAWLNTWSYGGYADRDAEWRIYAFTDRPAYRPEETVRWKFIARMRRDNEWITPSRGTIDYEIHGPRGEKVASGKATLNEFGSFWSDLPLKPSMPLGSYAITFHKTTDHNEVVGNAQLFRLEEYKLPEFRVDVHTPPGKQYRLGDTVEATIETS
ncbi:MAG TPA: MG2 domain-containing protein, partial [Thermoanaerobaculia bacterium]